MIALALAGLVLGSIAFIAVRGHEKPQARPVRVEVRDRNRRTRR